MDGRVNIFVAIFNCIETPDQFKYFILKKKPFFRLRPKQWYKLTAVNAFYYYHILVLFLSLFAKRAPSF